jgi:hypothetical protein
MHIVVEDPSGEWWEGGLVAEPLQAKALRARGVCLLPVSARLLQVSAAAGFYKRAWGAGVLVPQQGARQFCPMSIYALHDHHYLHWAARIVPAHSSEAEKGVDGSPAMRGCIRFVQDMTQQGCLAAAIEGAERDRVDVDQLGAPDAEGGWTVRGSARVRQMIDGHVAASLHGTAGGLRVLWAAMTQTSGPEEAL